MSTDDSHRDGPERRSALELMRIDDEQTAEETLVAADYKRWRNLKGLEEQAEENRDRMATDAAVATETMVATDLSDLAVAVEVFGNELLCYYDPEDSEIRDAVERVADVTGVDETDDPADLEGASVDDVDESDIPVIKSALVDLIVAATVEWRGVRWEELGAETRAEIRETIQQPHAEGGWGVAGLMDAFVEIFSSVEEHRNDRLERIRRFRDPERRGDR